jgi:hypothetical protein
MARPAGVPLGPLPTATCRSCNAPVIWARSASSGRLMPVDREPVDGGNVLVTRGPSGFTATVVGKQPQPNLFGDDGPRYTSHFATCPNADTHRRSR